MSDIEYLGYDEMDGSSNYLGVYSIRVALKNNSTIILGYKVQPTKDGTSLFVTAPSYKKTVEGHDVWKEFFILDSRSQNDEVLAVIKAKVKAYYADKNKTASQALNSKPISPTPTNPIDNPWGPPPVIHEEKKFQF